MPKPVITVTVHSTTSNELGEQTVRSSVTFGATESLKSFKPRALAVVEDAIDLAVRISQYEEADR